MDGVFTQSAECEESRFLPEFTLSLPEGVEVTIFRWRQVGVGWVEAPCADTHRPRWLIVAMRIRTMGIVR
jgi:hypothetical protein